MANRSLSGTPVNLITGKVLSGRPGSGHQGYAPGLVTGYAVRYLPGMRDTVERGDTKTARSYRDLLAFSGRDHAPRLA